MSIIFELISLTKKTFSFVLFYITINLNTYSQSNITLKLDTFLNLINDYNKGMGSISIFKNGVELYSKTIGYSNISASQKQLATSTSKYRIGSITKTFTAILILQLIEKGKLNYDTKLDDFFPKIPNAKQITIKNLLYHQSGIYDLLQDSIYLTNIEMQITKEKLLDILYKSKPIFLPNERTEYSNTNFILLGYIVEKLNNNSYDVILNEKIVTPLHLTNTRSNITNQADSTICNSYEYINNNWLKQPVTSNVLLGGAGCIVSSPTDLNTLYSNLFKYNIVTKNSLDIMTTIIQNYGMGILKLPYYKKIGYGHTGGIDGFRSIAIYFPDDSVSVAYVSNAEVYPTNEILLGVLNIYYNKPFTLPLFTTYSINLDELEKYKGSYTNKVLPLDIVIKIHGSTIIAQGTGQPSFPLTPIDKDKFSSEKYGVMLEFLTNKGVLKLYQNGQVFSFIRQ